MGGVAVADSEDPLVGVAQCAWVPNADRRLELWVIPEGQPRKLPVQVELRAVLGELEVEWVVGPLELDTTNSTPVPLGDPPPELARHPAAADYVATLSARVLVGDAEQTMPDAYLAWVDGTSASPVVWGWSELLAGGPNGVIDPALAAQLTEAGAEGLVLPPGRGDGVRTSFADDTGVVREAR